MPAICALLLALLLWAPISAVEAYLLLSQLSPGNWGRGRGGSARRVIIWSHLLPSVQCLDDGTWNGNQCFCLSGFLGDHCEFYPSTGLCENGGTWDGLKCICQPGFFGYQCQSLLHSISIDIPEIINATVGVLLKVTYRNFTKDLENASSEAYQNFTKLFKERMDEVYKDLLGYGGVIIRKLLNGSIVVEHDVILQANYTLDFQDVFKNLTKIVKAKITDETKNPLEDIDKCQGRFQLPPPLLTSLLEPQRPLCRSPEASPVPPRPRLVLSPALISRCVSGMGSRWRVWYKRKRRPGYTQGDRAEHPCFFLPHPLLADTALCYNEEDTVVAEVAKLNFDPQEQCVKNAAKDFAQFYYVDELKEKLVCVTKCTAGTKTQLNCNKGTCQLDKSGPHCLCPTTNTHWYWGQTCQWSTSKSLVYGSVGAVVVILVVTVVALSIFLGQFWRKLHSRQEYNLSHEWQGEEVPGHFQKWQGEEVLEGFQNTGIWEGTLYQGREWGQSWMMEKGREGVLALTVGDTGILAPPHTVPSVCDPSDVLWPGG
ncbi:mucin-12-like [Loxodonta africana]|uniref:mucin-12-like n=1 Tax=Loxodonta africana TaxID=9785 RepID=UPI0030D1F093